MEDSVLTNTEYPPSVSTPTPLSISDFTKNTPHPNWNFYWRTSVWRTGVWRLPLYPQGYHLVIPVVQGKVLTDEGKEFPTSRKLQ